MSGVEYREVKLFGLFQFFLNKNLDSTAYLNFLRKELPAFQ